MLRITSLFLETNNVDARPAVYVPLLPPKVKSSLVDVVLVELPGALP